MTDLRFGFDADSGLFDLLAAWATLAVGDDLETAVLVSLFTDARAAADDPLPGTDGDRRGWWGDAFPTEVFGEPLDEDRIGSRLWLLARALQTTDTLLRARQYAEEALAWMVTDGIAASITVETWWPAPGWLGLYVVITQPDGTVLSRAWEAGWDAQMVRPTVAGWLH